MTKSKRAYIFGAANSIYPCRHLPHKSQDDDLYIAVDGGLAVMQKMGIEPDIALGDFDSLPDDVTPNLNSGRYEVIKHPIEKDDTDTLLAIKLGFDRGYTSFTLYGCIGGERFDHSIATCQSLAYIVERGGNAIAYGEPLENGKSLLVTMLKNGSLTLPEDSDGHFSVFAYGGECHGVTLKNFKYEVSDVTLTPAFPLGVSNSFVTGNAGHVEVKSGCLLILYYA